MSVFVQPACYDTNRHESAMAVEKEGNLKEASLVQQRHDKAISELQVSLPFSFSTIVLASFFTRL